VRDDLYGGEAPLILYTHGNWNDFDTIGS